MFKKRIKNGVFVVIVVVVVFVNINVIRLADPMTFLAFIFPHPMGAVHFINILCAAFTRADPKSAKRHG